MQALGQTYNPRCQLPVAGLFIDVVGKYKLVTIDRPSAYSTTIMGNLDFFNQSQGHAEDWKALTLALLDEKSRVVAGITGGTSWEWLIVSHLWVMESKRRCGLGQSLMQKAEAEAIERGCHSAHLDTYSFQAVAFYLKIGYEEFGRLENYPRGHSRYYLRKKLISQ